MIFIIYITIITIIWYKQCTQNKQHKLPDHKLAKLHIRQILVDAITFLKSSALNKSIHKSSILYAIPWCLIIGKSNSGKTALLQNAKINVSYETNSKCKLENHLNSGFNFFFTNEAVFIDTTTLDKNNNLYWRYFLKYLIKYRRKQPLNCIIYVIDFTDVQYADELQLQNLAKTMRAYLHNVTELLGYRLPVVLVINKLDTLPGFFEFFRDNSIHQNDQAHGIKVQNSMAYDSKMEDIAKQLQDFCGQLSIRAIGKLSHQDNHLHKISLLNFVEQFRKYTENIFCLLSDMLSENPYQETSNVYGVYFVSALKSYGLRELLAKFITQDNTIIEKTRYNIQNQLWLNSLKLSAICVTIIGVVALYGVAYSQNAKLLNHGVTLSAQYISEMQHSFNNYDISELYILYSYYDQLINYQNTMPWYKRLGLYKGKLLISSIHDFLMNQCAELYIMPIDNKLQMMLQNDADQWRHDNELQRQQLRGNYYATLKAYLMLHFPQQLDVDFVHHLLITQQLIYSGDNQNITNNNTKLLLLISFYLHQLQWNLGQLNPSENINSGLVVNARQQLFANSSMINEYSQLRTNGIATLGTASLQELLPGNHLEIYGSQYRLPRLFTIQGWQQYMLPAMKQLSSVKNQSSDWVISMPLNLLTNRQAINMHNLTPATTSNDQLIEQLQQLYFNDYVNVWIEFLHSISISAFGSLDETTKKLQMLSGQNGPFVKLNQIVIQNLNVININMSSVNNSAYLQSLLSVRSELEPFLVSADASRDAKLLAAQILLGNADNNALYHSSLVCNQNADAINNAQLREAYLQVLLLPIKEAWRNVLILSRQDIQQQWQDNIVAIYQQKLFQKVPFIASGDDATVEDVSQFLHPITGVLWQFVDQQLSPFLIQNAQTWQEKKWLGVGIQFTPEFLNILSHAYHVSDELFHQQDNQINFQVMIYPVPTPGVDEISITTNGNTYRYRNEPQQWQQFDWTIQNKNNDTLLKILTEKDKTPFIIEINSSWGIFQLLRRAEITKESNDMYRATWKFHNEGNAYKISLLFKGLNQTELYHEIVSGKFRVTDRIFLSQ